MSVNTWFGTDPPTDGRTAGDLAGGVAPVVSGALTIVAVIDARTNSAHG
jgi:hypothetical protein